MSLRRTCTHLILSSLVFLLLTSAVTLPTKAITSDTSAEFLNVTDGDLQLAGQRYVMKGFNYLPGSSRHSPMTKWNWQEVERDLRLASQLGANTVRTFVHFYDIADDPLGLHVVAAQTFLEIAERHGLRVIFSLFENMPGYDIIDGANYERGYQYLRDFVDPLRQDARIAAWDILNEGDYLAVRYRETTTFTNVMNFYRAMASEMRKIDENHLLTAGFASLQQVHETAPFVDFLSFHSYGDAHGLTDQLTAMIARVAEMDEVANLTLPIVVTETGAPSAGNQWSTERTQMLTMADQLETIIQDKRLDGALVWQLTDYTPRTLADGSNAENQPTEPYYGLFTQTLRAKPALAIVQRYFRESCTSTEQQLRLQISNELEQPLVGDGRFLSGAYRSLRALDGNGQVLKEWSFRTMQVERFMGAG